MEDWRAIERQLEIHENFNMCIYSVNAFIEATHYLLGQEDSYIQSQVFCQDPLEEHFGRHRSLRARQDNPTILQFMCVQRIHKIYIEWSHFHLISIIGKLYLKQDTFI